MLRGQTVARVKQRLVVDAHFDEKKAGRLPPLYRRLLCVAVGEEIVVKQTSETEVASADDRGVCSVRGCFAH